MLVPHRGDSTGISRRGINRVSPTESNNEKQTRRSASVRAIAGPCVTCGEVRFAKVPGIFRTIHEIANVSVHFRRRIDYTLEDVTLVLSSISGLSDLFNYEESYVLY